MIVCSCTLISDRDIDRAVVEIMSSSRALLPTPGVVFRHLKAKMNCCSCAPLTVAVIYEAMARLESDTRICSFALAEVRSKLARVEGRRRRRAAIEIGGQAALL